LKKILIVFCLIALLSSILYPGGTPTFVVVNDQLKIFTPNSSATFVDFNEAPFSLPSATFSAVIYGDSRWGDKTHEELVKQMLKLKPDVVVHLGDMVNNGCNEEDWKKFYSITEPLRRNSFFQIVKGNHENPDRCYNKHFDLHNYYATFADVRFVFLDLEIGLDKAEKFLKTVSTNKTIVFTHYPIFTAGPHRLDSIVKKAKKLHEIFKELGIKLVFSSHDHNYQKFRKGGIVYIVSGGGGAALYSISNPFEPLEWFKTHHFVHIYYNGLWIEAKVIDRSGKTIDEFSIYF